MIMKVKKIISLWIVLGILYLVLGTTSAQFSQTEDVTLSDFDVKTATQNMQDLQSSVDDITQELYNMDAKEKTDAGISDKYRETRNEVVNVINNINKTTENVGSMLKKIAIYKIQIASAGEELKAAREWMVSTKDYLADFANFIYKLNNKLYTDNGSIIDDIKLIVNSDNIPRTLANDYMVQSMILQLNDLMGNFTANEEKQIEIIKKLSRLKAEAGTQIKDFEVELEKLQQKKNYLIQFLSLYKNDKIQRQIAITNLFESTKGVYDKMASLVKDISKWVYTSEFNMDKKIVDLNKIEKDTEAYALAWPIYPITEIQTYFGDELYQKQYGVPHIGIQIKAIQWSPVYSARDGIVYFVADNDQIGINRVMIAHANGYITAYQYMNKIFVKPGDIVRRGQLIGNSGGEPGTRWAGFVSKWPNLTFITFKDGIAVDPFTFLDASIVKEKTALPDGYQIKYLRDKYARPIDITDLEIMTWPTLALREDQFLTRYGVGIYREAAFREDAASNTSIDKDVMICIAFAESTLGRYLATSNNIGNVGNDDSGNRIPFYSALAGARSIALTLNNDFLWDYHTIKQLSRYGNKDGKIYASSPINRQTNVLKCLSQIKGYYIPEDFPFRTGLNPNKVKVDLASGTETIKNNP